MSVIGVTTASHHFGTPVVVRIRYLEPPAAAAAREVHRVFRSLARAAVEEAGERAVQQGAGIRQLEPPQPLRVDVEQLAVEAEDLDAVAGALDDPPVHLLGLAERLLAAPALGDVGAGPGHADGRAIGAAHHRSPREEPADAAVAVQHAMLDLVGRRLVVDVSLARSDTRAGSSGWTSRPQSSRRFGIS